MGALDGKVALITGGARGQGAAEAELFVAEGADVVITDVLDEPAEALSATLGPSASYLHLDVASEGEWDDVVARVDERFGRLDVVVNNAGVLSEAANIESQPLDDYMRIVSINQVGCWLGMKKTIPLLRRGGGGSIVNISSVAGMRGAEGSAAYAATKWAVRGMTKCAALEVARDGVRVNSVHPGFVDTQLLSEVGTDAASLGPKVPLGAVGQPADVARLALFLASDASAYCTGAEFVIDGGLLAGGVKS